MTMFWRMTQLMLLFITVTECTMCQIHTTRPYLLQNPDTGNEPCRRMNSLLNNDTFEICRLPEGRKVIGGRWVYAVKLGPNGDEQYKARYVAKGYSQVQDIDYSETFSPTVRINISKNADA